MYKTMRPITISMVLLNILVVSAVMTGFEALAKEPVPDKIILQLKWKHQFQFAGFYAAHEKGYYRDSGLDVFIQEGKPGLKPTDEVVSGRADYGIDSPSLLLERHKGKPVVVLAAILQHSAEALVALKDSGIASAHDLIGKKVLMRPRVDVELLAMFKNEGISHDRIQIIDHTWQINDLIERKVDVSGGYVTDLPFLVKEQGMAYSVISPITYGIDFYGDCLFTSEHMITQEPVQTQAFLDASLKGWSYAMAHPEEMIDLIISRYDTRLSRKALQFEASAMQKLMLPKFIQIGHMNPGRWKHIADTFVSLNMLPSDYSLDGFLYNPNPQPDYTGMKRIIQTLSGLVICIGLGSFFLFLFNRRLNHRVAERTEHLTREIKKREKIQNDLKHSLKEKDVLLKEVHHRVKNNLQMVESLLNLQLSELEDDTQAAPVVDSKNRVRSMALVHETLYRSGKLSAVNIKKYIEGLVNPLLESLKPPDVTIELSYDIEQIFLDLDAAVACGLIINELVNNSVKHAFRQTKTGAISISMKRAESERIVLQIEDNGIGMPPENYISNPGTLGLQIVRLIAEGQLEGDVRVKSEHGLTFTIGFPLNEGGFGEHES